MSQMPSAPAQRRVHWRNLSTVVSAAFLIGTETIGVAYAFSWALAGWLGLGDLGTQVLHVVGFALGVSAIVWFLRRAVQVEPIWD